MRRRIYKTVSNILSVLLSAMLCLSCLLTAFAKEGSEEMTAFDVVSEFKIGWNLGNTFDCYNVSGEIESLETAWGNPKTTKAMIDTVKQAGFGAVRIPITWDGRTDENDVIYEAWLDRIKEVVDYVIDNDMYAVINMHHDDYTWLCPSYEKEEAVTKRYTKIWAQVAEYFKEYDYHLLFEGMNEPRIVGEENEWNIGTKESRDVVNRLNHAFVKTVRTTGGNNKERFLIVTPHAASSEEAAINALKIPDDKNLIVSVHYYFPYDLALSTDANPQWGSKGDKKELVKGFDRVKAKFIDKGIPVIIGEFGALYKDNNETRKEYLYYYIKQARERGIPCFIWDNGAHESGERFGLLDRANCTWRHKAVLESAINAALETEIKLNYKSTASIVPQISDGDKISYENSNDSVVRINSETGEMTAVGAGQARIKCTVTAPDGSQKTEIYLVTVSYAWWQWLIRILLFGIFWY